MRFRSLAERWADAKYVKENRDLRYELTNAKASVQRLKQERDHASNAVHTLKRLREATQATYQQRTAELAQELLDVKAANDRQAGLLEQCEADLAAARDGESLARREAAEANENCASAEAELAGANKLIDTLHEQENRIASMRAANELLERELAEANTTVSGLGLQMADLERDLAGRRILLPGQRADLHDPYKEKRYYDGLGDGQ